MLPGLLGVQSPARFFPVPWICRSRHSSSVMFTSTVCPLPVLLQFTLLCRSQEGPRRLGHPRRRLQLGLASAQPTTVVPLDQPRTRWFHGSTRATGPRSAVGRTR
jgi:hypothetical protein